MNKVLDFRSDTVTRPTAAMRAAMQAADVGDDVYGEDPTVNALQENAAAMLGYEAALYGVSGTQTNLLGLMAHCQRGEEVIVSQTAHTYRWEGGGMAVLGSIQPQPLDPRLDGTMDMKAIEAAIKPDDAHHAITRLIALENTTGGKVLPAQYIQEVKALANRRGLQTHLDGARLFNAAVFTAKQNGTSNIDAAREICKSFDSVSVCLSKGLGAPVGSLLLGSKALIGRAHRLRKMIGGGMRQAGVIAAAGAYALERNIDRLADDHANAALLAKGLGEASRGQLKIDAPQTNILWAEFPIAIGDAFAAHLKANDILVSGAYGKQRWVTHLDLDRADIERAVAVTADFFSKN
ncbi:MAG: low-specificity L-threonine aldolase [Betaproteobacteria bacterium]|nr:low-specificity L-threonine aldolase [Betaproteobacteria bacterium]